MDHTWYFAYGSNMQTATFSGRRGIDFRRAITVRARGWRLVLDKPPLLPIGEAFANIVPDAQAEVLGVAYHVASAALHTIDLTEGVLIGNYERRAIAVEPLNGDAEPLEAFTLLSERRDASLLPSTRYMRLLIEGALEHGLPAPYVESLRAVEACAESRAAAALLPLLDGAMALLKARK